MEFRYSVKIFFVCLFAIICFGQCFTIIRNFLEYPAWLKTYDVSSSLLTILPALTICNNNRLSLKKLAKRNEKFATALRNRYPNWLRLSESYLDKKDSNDFRDEVASILKELNHDPQDEIDETNTNELFDKLPDAETFIKWFSCARTWTEAIECSNITRIESIQNRRCTTILHRGAMFHDRIHRPHLFNSTRKSADKFNYFDAKQIIKIILDFEPEDYADLKRQIGARVMIHDGNIVSSSSSLDFFVTRGYKYDFTIDRLDVKLIEEPYYHCWRYDDVNLKKYTLNVNPRAPLTSETCLQNCIVGHIINRFNCWPPTMPYFKNDIYDPNLNLKRCYWFRGIQQLNPPSFTHKDEIRGNRTSDERMRIYNEIKRYCWSQCAFPCNFTKYSVSVTKSVWPSDVRILFDKSGQDRLNRHCCAMINVKYSHFHYNVQEFTLKHDWLDTLGDMGGLLAVWLGLSIVSVYKAIQKLVELCTNRSR